MLLWLRAALFILVVPGTIAGWLPWYLATSVGAAPRPPILALRALAGLLIAVGWAGLLSGTRDFIRRGRGTPAPLDTPRTLVTAGLYERVRNPMYLAVLLAIVGQALWFGAPRVLLYAAGIALLFHSFVVLYEEPTLARAFGVEFERYRARVPRWLPRVASRRVSRPPT